MNICIVFVPQMGYSKECSDLRIYIICKIYNHTGNYGDDKFNNKKRICVR